MIYFMQPGDGGLVLIVTSDTDAGTIRDQAEQSFHKHFEMIGVMPGGWPERCAIFDRFGYARVGESDQFRPGPDLMGFVGRLTKPTLPPRAPEAVLATAAPTAPTAPAPTAPIPSPSLPPGIEISVDVRVESELYQRVHAAAMKRGLTPSAFILDATTAALGRLETP